MRRREPEHGRDGEPSHTDARRKDRDERFALGAAAPDESVAGQPSAPEAGGSSPSAGHAGEMALGGTPQAGESGGGSATIPSVLRCESRGEYCTTTSDCPYYHRCENERCVKVDEGSPCIPDETTKYTYRVAQPVVAAD